MNFFLFFGKRVGKSTHNDPATNFRISTSVASIFIEKLTKTFIILVANTSPPILTSSSKSRALLSTSLGVPMTSRIFSRSFTCTHSFRISSSYAFIVPCKSVTCALRCVMWAFRSELSSFLSFFSSLMILPTLQSLRSLEFPKMLWPQQANSCGPESKQFS